MTHIMGWCALGDMVRVAHVSRALKAIACAPDSWDVLHLHETLNRDALGSLAKTFPNALRSAREICISVLHRSAFRGLAAFLEHACPTKIVDGDGGGGGGDGGDDQDSSTQPRFAKLGSLGDALANRTLSTDAQHTDSASETSPMSTATSSWSASPMSIPESSALPSSSTTAAVAATTKKVGGGLPNRRLRRLYLIDVDMRAPELAMLGALFPNLDELALFEHGSGVSQTYDAGAVFTRMLSDWPHLQSLVVRFAGQPSPYDVPPPPPAAAAAVVATTATTTWRLPPTLARLCVSAWRIADPQPIEMATGVLGADFDVDDPPPLPAACRLRIELPHEKNAALERLRLEDARICRLVSAAIDDPLPCLTQLYATAGAFTDTRTLARLLATETLGAVTLERMRLTADVMGVVAPPLTQPAMRSLTLRGCETSLDFVRAVARRYTHLEDLRVVHCEKDGGGGAAGDYVENSLRVADSHGPHVTSVIDVDQALACLAESRAFVAGRLLHVQMPYSPIILLAPPPTSSASSPSSFSSPSLPSPPVPTRTEPCGGPCGERDAKRSTVREAKAQTTTAAAAAAPLLPKTDGGDVAEDRADTGNDGPRLDTATDDDVRRNLTVVDWRADAPACRLILWNTTDPSGTRATHRVASLAPPDAVSVRSLLPPKPPTQTIARLIVTNSPFASRCEASVYSPGLALLVAAGSDCVVTFGNAKAIIFRGAVPCGVRASSAVPLRHWSAALVRAVSTAESASPLSDRPLLLLLLLSSPSPSPLEPCASRSRILGADSPVAPKTPQIFAVGLARLGQVTHLCA